MVKKDIALSDLLENVASVRQLRDLLGRQIAVLRQMVEPFKLANLREECQIQRSVNIKDLFIGELQLILKDLQKPFIDAGSNLKADRVTVTALFELLLDFLEKVLRLIFIDVHVGASHNPVRCNTDDIIVKEQAFDILPDNRLQKDHPCLALLLAGKPDDSGEDRGNLHRREFQGLSLLLALFRLLVAVQDSGTRILFS